MKILIISVGKGKEIHFDDIWNEYSGRVNRSYPLEWLFLPNDIDSIKEGEKILSKVKEGDYVICLDEIGKELSTVELADFLQMRLNQGIKRLVFIIGGSYGLSQKVKEKADFTLSLSKLTLPHLLVRILLSETLYRAISVIKGDPYHHS